MEIFTLLKANIRHKKGSFVSIIILMVIISMSFTAIYSIKENCVNSIKNAQNSMNMGDLFLFVTNDLLSDELLESVENHSSVKEMVIKEAVVTFGAEFGDSKDSNPWMMLPLTDEYRLLNEEMTDYAENIPSLKSGEIYISQGLSTRLSCDIGDKIKINTITGIKEFTIKGFVVDPVCGSMNMGIKHVFVSDDDFVTLQNDAISNATEVQNADYRVIQIHKADENLSDSQFARKINHDTGIVDYSLLSFTKAQSFEYTNIFPDMILSVLLAFVAFLVGIVLIVMAHSISTSIEMEYSSLGVLKAQGFTANKIKVILASQYLFAQIIGAVIGMALALPIIKIFGNIFQPVVSTITEYDVSVLESLLFIIGVLFISILFVFVSTHKVGKISPMRAISGGKNDVYFNSRLNAPISKRALSSSLALRQFTSNKRRYIVTIIIITFLMFFMITMPVLGTSIDSKSAMESMGMPSVELSLDYKDTISDSKIDEIEGVIKKYTEIDKKYILSNMTMTLNGDEYMCAVYKNPEIMLMEEGRYPQYDNEIAITDILAEELNLEIGDKVTVSSEGYKVECIITGKNVFANDLGRNFSIPLETAKKLGVDDVYYCGFSLTDSSEVVAIADEINEKYSDLVTATAYESDHQTDMYALVIDAMTAVIYVISIIFSLVVVMMVCKKAFLQERRDIGIYKSLGFTSSKLRLQFAVRFLIVSLIGSAFGAILSLLFTEDILTAVFRLLGVSSFNAQFTSLSFVVPIAMIGVSFFVFAYIASSRIKRVEIKELVIE